MIHLFLTDNIKQPDGTCQIEVDGLYTAPAILATHGLVKARDLQAKLTTAPRSCSSNDIATSVGASIMPAQVSFQIKHNF